MSRLIEACIHRGNADLPILKTSMLSLYFHVESCLTPFKMPGVIQIADDEIQCAQAYN